MMYFDNCKTLEDGKRKYRLICKLFHPDRGGDTELMRELIESFEEFEEMSRHMQNRPNKIAGDEVLEKIHMILKWAEEPKNRKFDPSFVESLLQQYIEKGYLTSRQMECLDRLIRIFHVE